MRLLINPTTMVQDGYTPPPLGLLYLAAADAETVVFDAALMGAPDEFLRRHRPEVVGVTMYTLGRHESLRILELAKSLGAKTVAGGPHVAVMLAQLAANYPFIDHLVVGDGEAAWAGICRGVELPRVVKMPIGDLNALSHPKWDAVPLGRYPARGAGVVSGVDLGRVPRVSIVLGRGCSGRCSFCSTWWVNGAYRAHNAQWMAKTLDDLWQRGVRHLVFQDDCLSADREAAVGLCDVLSRYNFAWFGTTRIDCLDEELAGRMKACGCYELTFGIESGSEEILRRMNKRTRLEQAFVSRAACAKHGIRFTALMMYGFPFESPATQAETAYFLQRLRPDAVGALGHVMVLPGTALYQACKQKGLIDDSFWLGPDPVYIYRGGL